VSIVYFVDTATLSFGDGISEGGARSKSRGEAPEMMNRISRVLADTGLGKPKAIDLERRSARVFP
jgi:hypothetical protein